MSVAAGLFVKKGISQDEETAKKILLKSMNNVRATSITMEQYNQIFCKNIFKDALINVNEAIEKSNKGATETPLQLKLGVFQRGLIEPGLHKGHDDSTRDAKAIMNALFALQCVKNP